MPTKKFVQTFVLLTIMPSAILWLHAQSSQNVPGIALDQLELHNVKAEAANYNGKPAVRVDALPDAANGASYAILKGSRFHNGTIEVELAGKTGANAGPGLAALSESRSGSRATASNTSTSGRRMGGGITRFAGTTLPSTPRTRNSISTGCGRNRRRNMNRTWTWSRGDGPSTGS